MGTIDLKGLDKAAVLAALYNASKPQGMGFLHYNPTPMTIERAKELLEQTTDFDYLMGRVMKINLGGDTLNTWGYDRDNGEGAAAKAIESMQATSNPNNDEIRHTHDTSTVKSAQQVQSKIDEESRIEVNGSVAILCLGYADVKDILAPKVSEAKSINKGE